MKPYSERQAFGEPRVLAFDIECCKQPLKFPDAQSDPVCAPMRAMRYSGTDSTQDLKGVLWDLSAVLARLTMHL